MLLSMIRNKVFVNITIIVFALGWITSCASEHPTGRKPEKEHPAGVEKPIEEKEQPAETQPEQKEQPAQGVTPAEKITLEDVANVTEEYVQENSEDGIFRYYDEKTDQQLELKLDKVHRDRLSQTKEDEYFVCADFKGMDGNMYDLDLFVQGKTKDELQVDEDSISVHKVNGKERYTWKYNKKEDVWEKQPVPGEKEHPEPPKKEHP